MHENNLSQEEIESLRQQFAQRKNAKWDLDSMRVGETRKWEISEQRTLEKLKFAIAKTRGNFIAGSRDGWLVVIREPDGLSRFSSESIMPQKRLSQVELFVNSLTEDQLTGFLGIHNMSLETFSSLSEQQKETWLKDKGAI